MSAGSKVTVKSRKGNGVGTFISGMMFMFMIFFFTVVGLGLWVTEYVTVGKLEKVLGFELNLGTDPSGIKQMNLLELITFGSTMASQVGTMSLNDLELNFGIKTPNTFYGIDLSPLKSVAIANINDGLNKIAASITLNNVAGIMQMDLPDMVIIANNADLPIAQAIDNIFGALDEQTMTLQTLTDFGIDVSTIELLAGLPLDTKISELSVAIQDKTVGELLSVQSPSGFLRVISGIKLSDLPDKLNTLTVGEMLGLDETATGVMGAIKHLKLTELDGDLLRDAISTVQLADLIPADNFDDTESLLYKLKGSTFLTIGADINALKASEFFDTSSGLFSLISADTTLTDLPFALSTALKMDVLKLSDLKTIDPSLQIPAGWENATVAEMIAALGQLPSPTAP